MDMEGLETFIIAGGRGERLRPIAPHVPKPLIPVFGRPLLDHQLSWLRREKIKEATLCLGYGADLIRAHLEGKDWGLRLDCHVEDRPLGTAGCVRRAARAGTDFLVVYGDLFIEMDLARFWECHQRHPESAATLAV